MSESCRLTESHGPSFIFNVKMTEYRLRLRAAAVSVCWHTTTKRIWAVDAFLRPMETTKNGWPKTCRRRREFFVTGKVFYTALGVIFFFFCLFQRWIQLNLIAFSLFLRGYLFTITCWGSSPSPARMCRIILTPLNIIRDYANAGPVVGTRAVLC